MLRLILRYLFNEFSKKELKILGVIAAAGSEGCSRDDVLKQNGVTVRPCHERRVWTDAMTALIKQGFVIGTKRGSGWGWYHHLTITQKGLDAHVRSEKRNTHAA